MARPNLYCIWAFLLALPAGAFAQPPAQPAPAAPTSHAYTIFVGGTVAGREDVTVTSAANGLTISGSGRVSGSLDIIMRRAEVHYRPDWTPDVFELEALVNGGDTMLQTTFSPTAALTKGVDGGRQIDQTNPLPGPTILVLPNVFFGAYEALTRRLLTAMPGQEFPAFVGAGALGSLQLMAAGTDRMQVGTRTFAVRHYVLTYASPRGPLGLDVYSDDMGSLLRVSIPSRTIDVMRDDLASSTARTVLHSNTGDEAVTIRATGFNLGATVTTPRRDGPSGPPATRMPAVVLMSGVDDRDGVIGGIPIMGQLAGALADAGYLVVRYDRRGFGQSGGRAESATLGDYADDAVAVVRYLSERKDVDRNRIAVLGHNEGAWAAFVAADREKRIGAVVSIAAPSVNGADRILEQQRHLLDELKAPPAETNAKIELQRQINAAVLTGKGWDTIPPEMRKQADTPWFQSFLVFDPAKVLDDIRQPLLLMHGDLDSEVPVEHVDRLAEIARKESKSKAIAVVTVRGVNHLLVTAATGDVDEYASLADRKISPEVTLAITDWLTKTFQSAR